MHFNNLSVVRKLWGLVLGLMVTMLLLLGGTVGYLVHLGNESDRIVQETEHKLTLALRWQGQSALAVERGVLGVRVTDEALSERLRQQTQEGIRAVNELHKQIEALATTAEDRAQLERVAAARTPVLQHNVQAAKMRAENDFAGVFTLVDEQLLPAVERYAAEQDAFARLQERQRDAAHEAARTKRQRAIWIGLLAAGVTTLVGVALAGGLVRSITRPLARAAGLADAIAAGDLTQDVHDDRRDELGRLLRALSGMGTRLRTLVSEVRAGVESVSSASSQIATGNQDLSARTEQTAANLQQTASSMEELTATVTQSADTARQANQLAATAAQAAERGGQVVGQVVASMQQITDSSRRISDIIGVIDSIAFQTNILALNAAVEAARAGQQGRGFAVVASEVRNLAQRSAEAAKEIKQLITTSVDNVQAGSAQVEEAGRSMHDIVNSVRRVGDLIGEITASSSEQRDGISQVNQAVAQLDQMTQQNAALVEESSAAAAAMRDQAQRLAQVVSIFDVGGAAAVAVAQAPRRPAQAVAPAVPVARTPAAKVAARAPAPQAPQIAPARRAAAPAATASDDDWESF